MRTKIFKFSILFIAIAFIVMPVFAYAQEEGEDYIGLVPCGRNADDPGTKNIDEAEPCEVCDFFAMAKRVIDFIVLRFVPPVAVLFFVVGGIVLYTSGGSESRVAWARKVLFGVVIGLLVIYGAWMLIDSTLLMVSDSFTPQPPGFPWPWNEITC